MQFSSTKWRFTLKIRAFQLCSYTLDDILCLSGPGEVIHSHVSFTQVWFGVEYVKTSKLRTPQKVELRLHLFGLGPPKNLAVSMNEA